MAAEGFTLWDSVRNSEALLTKPHVQFLYIHHILKNEEQKLAKRLSTHHTFISYSEGVARILENKVDKAYISISSDDGFKNNMAAAGILDNYEIKACFFVDPSMIEYRTFVEIETHFRERLNFPPVEFLDWKDIAQLQKWGMRLVRIP